MSKKILIVDDTHPLLIDKLTESGFICHYQPAISRKEIIEIVSDYYGLVIRSKTKIDQPLLDKATNLQFIGRYGAGMENIDVAYAESKGIICLNAPEGNRNAVAEHEIGLLFALLNNICIANEQIKRGIWNRNNNWGHEIEGKTIGIIGYGNTGSTFARKLKGFDVGILAYDKYKTNFGNDYVQESSLETLFEKADVLSLHIPLTPETNKMVNLSFIEKFKKPFIFLNTSRGQIVNTQDLIMALKSKKIKAAALDVLEYEKLDFESMYSDENETLKNLLSFNNVILTPHIAGWTYQSYEKLAKKLAEKIMSLYKRKRGD